MILFTLIEVSLIKLIMIVILIMMTLMNMQKLTRAVMVGNLWYKELFCLSLSIKLKKIGDLALLLSSSLLIDSTNFLIIVSII